MPDHNHILIGLRPEQSLSSLMQNTKTESSKCVNSNKLSSSKFQGQDGYGAFSYSKSQLPQVIEYIQNQEQHQKMKSFIEEYKSILDAFELEWDGKYIFHELL